uniref:26S proteasome non-ATPase regulatory subunit 3 n=1 Tax=Anisakis simplex TaxID=6269 RepID=A0A346RVP4_ANISI|nr:26S proteasome non-ATPase regulatory subunit 3 [Anisakis simplex]
MVEKMEVDEATKGEGDQKNTEGEKSNEKKDKEPEKPVDLDAITLENLKEWCNQLEKGETHVLSRMLQLLPKTRKQINADVLHKLVSNQLAALPLNREQLLTWLPPLPPSLTTVPMEIDVGSKGGGRSPRPSRRAGIGAMSPTAEVELYVHLLVLVYLVDQKQWMNAEKCAESLITRLDYYDKRSVDAIAAKAFFYMTLIYERTHKLEMLRAYLNGRLRTATLKRQSDTQAVLIVCLLRVYLLGKHYQAAAKLVSKVTFPEGASNNDLARFLYYQGRIKAMQLDYTAAAGYFLQAIRKAPQDSAIGFKQNVQKWVVVINLLQGEIPERSIFRVPIHRRTLAPYLELTQAVRLGDLMKFNSVLEKHAERVFGPDETLPLIVRLRQNVIKTALRQISTAYSCISISDIRKKLLLQSDHEAEYLVAKAIKDGSIEAVITFDTDVSDRYMQSKQTEDIYRTTEPQTHFDTRIRYCLELHNQAVKALRYPANSHKGVVESIEEQREREQQNILRFQNIYDYDLSTNF